MLLWLLSSYSIVGPGYLSYANPGVLEKVAERRIKYGWGLGNVDLSQYDILVAPEDCSLIGKTGWLIVSGGRKRVIVVDCQNRDEERRMSDDGLLADVNSQELVHQKGWLLLK